MKFAVLSDVHGNLDALTEVFSDVNALDVRRIFCLGDMIGYGPQPEAVIREIRRHPVHALMGNHELALVDRDYLDWFNRPARQSLVHTSDMLSYASMTFIRELKPFFRLDAFHFVHGYPPDSPLTYLFQVSEETLEETFVEADFRVCFLGHTHDLEHISWNGDRIIREPLARGRTVLSKSEWHLLNIGSVGQPRDGNPDAKYVIFDPEENTVDLRHVPYDYAATAKKIIAAGLPEVHARKLFPR